jgi:predicted DNA-binding protein (MmcQ/YjbR family)
VDELFATIREYALRLPGAYEDFPWGESVAKVNKKVFAFFGRAADEPRSLSVKLPASAAAVVARGLGTPTGYGLGKSGWVTLPLNDSVTVHECLSWIEESYRAVAPKKLIAQLS